MSLTDPFAKLAGNPAVAPVLKVSMMSSTEIVRYAPEHNLNGTRYHIISI
jgi:hypothetical protein